MVEDQLTGALRAARTENENAIRRQEEKLRLLELEAQRAKNELLIQQREQELEELYSQTSVSPTLRRQRSATLEHQFDGMAERTRQRVQSPPRTGFPMHEYERAAKPAEPKEYTPGRGAAGQANLQDFLRACSAYRDLRPGAFRDDEHFFKWCGQKLKGTAAQDWDAIVLQEGTAAFNWEKFRTVLDLNLHPEASSEDYWVNRWYSATQRPEQSALNYWRYLNSIWMNLPSTHRGPSEHALRSKFASGLRNPYRQEMERYGKLQLGQGESLQSVAAHIDAVIRPKEPAEHPAEQPNFRRTEGGYFQGSRSTTQYGYQGSTAGHNGPSPATGVNAAPQGHGPPQQTHPPRYGNIASGLRGPRPARVFIPDPEREARRAAGACLKCGDQGHWTMACPNGWSLGIRLARATAAKPPETPPQ
jgi:Retrotransposon gag protein